MKTALLEKIKKKNELKIALKKQPYIEKKNGTWIIQKRKK